MEKKQQKQLITYARGKIRAFFDAHPSPGHGFHHAVRTAQFGKLIARFEKQNIFLAELAGLLHDIGYLRYTHGSSKSHHEHSYELAREWFRKDVSFNILTRNEKIIVLYSLRYHGNDDANLYQTAWILRDADKLDGLGIVGLKRSRDYCSYSGQSPNVDLRLRFHIAAYLKSEWSKNLLKNKKLLKPFQLTLAKNNRASIKPIKL
ncbi:MAG: HD domain-containing protein [Candidatus Magasanikbacteria bacterium]|nr:HD domain-containing protein [Candidatus Magasanikbacteria bacterium]